MFAYKFEQTKFQSFFYYYDSLNLPNSRSFNEVYCVIRICLLSYSNLQKQITFKTNFRFLKSFCFEICLLTLISSFDLKTFSLEVCVINMMNI